MPGQKGANIRDVGASNRGLVLRTLCTHPPMSRSQLAREMGLAKMTLSNIVAGLIGDGIVQETGSSDATGAGRRPVLLDLSPRSPCVCGMLIKRGLYQVILADLRGRVLDRTAGDFPAGMDSRRLVQLLIDAFRQLEARTRRDIAAVSVSSLGPVDTVRGFLLNPPDFYGIRNVPLTQLLAEALRRPVFLTHDASAGALAESLYGGGTNANFLYCHCMQGIGAGIVIDGRIYGGDTGQSGEIGHTSINFSGPKCSCGNRGCLDLYANIGAMREKAEEFRACYPHSPLFAVPRPAWEDFLNAARLRDPPAVAALDSFCGYLAGALVNTLNLLDISLVVVGYPGDSGGFLEDSIARRLNERTLFSGYRTIAVQKSAFGGDAPLLGSAAVVADRIFDGSFDLIRPADDRPAGDRPA